MPVIVIGADTEVGEAILERMLDPEREVRAFVTDPDVAVRWKERGVKVALGDVSDVSHVMAACTNAFSAVLVGEAATDARERSFAVDPAAVLAGWAEAVTSAGVQRSIWVLDSDPPEVGTPESATVAAGISMRAISNRVAELDDRVSLS